MNTYTNADGQTFEFFPKTAELADLMHACNEANRVRKDAKLLHGKNSEEYAAAKRKHDLCRADLRAFANA